MKTQEFLSEIKNTYAEGIDIINSKNKDYANSENPFKNFETSIILGITPEKGIMIRMLDKVTRISNLLEKEACVKDETIDDTLLDLINYTAILKAYITSKREEDVMPF
jgi:hypothetical protein